MSIAQQPSHSIIGEEDLAGVNIYSIVQDNDNTIWLSTNNGLYHYDGITFTSIKSNSTRSISIESNSALFVSERSSSTI